MNTISCMPCDNEARVDTLPPRECVYLTDHWRVVHAFNSTLPGWMVVLPRMPDFPPEVRGPSVFAFLRDSPDEWLSDTELDEIALRVRAELG